MKLAELTQNMRSFHLNNIARTIILWSDRILVSEILTKEKPESFIGKEIKGYSINYYYLSDTALSEIEKIEKVDISGLYYMESGEKKIPHRVYFGVGTRNTDNGLAYCHIISGLTPIYCKDGKRLRIDNLSNVLSDYDGNTLYNFRRE